MQVISVDELVKYQGENVIVDSFEAVPISVLDDIKAEINEAYQQSVTSNLYYAEGLEKAFEIIEKYIAN